MKETQDSTALEINETLDLLAKKFALLLAVSDLDDKVQATLINAIPHLELEQIINLVSALEAKYTNSKTVELDVLLKEKLEQVAKTFSEQQQSRDEDLLHKLEELANKID